MQEHAEGPHAKPEIVCRQCEAKIDAGQNNCPVCGAARPAAKDEPNKPQ